MAYQALILRNPARAAATVREFDQLGITSRCAQLIETIWPEDRSELELMGRELLAGDYSWLVFTSVNTVKVVHEVLAGSPLPAGVQIASVGQKTTEAIAHFLDHPVHFQPVEQSAAGMMAAWAPEAGASICYPHGDLASSTLADGLANMPVQVREVIAYQTVDAPSSGTPIDEPDVPAGLSVLPVAQIGATLEELDFVVFAAPSGVRRFIEVAGSRIPARTACLAIGQPTARAMEQAGLPVAAIAAEPTPKGLAQAAKDLLQRRA